MNISIITNFGCNKKCWYCIWKNHKLNNYKKIDYSKLEDFLVKNKSFGKVSLSGGGDPLYNYFNNITFWKFIINITKRLNLKLDIHTRELIVGSVDHYSVPALVVYILQFLPKIY